MIDLRNDGCFCDKCYPDKDAEDLKLIEDIKRVNLDLLRELENRLLNEN